MQNIELAKALLAYDYWHSKKRSQGRGQAEGTCLNNCGSSAPAGAPCCRQCANKLIAENLEAAKRLADDCEYRDSASIKRRTDWIQLVSGKPFFPLDPRVEAIEIEDIAWSLSMQCRYAGHSRIFYSVAEHCVHLSHAAPPEAALWALLHDASEAYLTRLPRPVKQGIPEYKAIEERVMRCVAERFGLTLPEPAIVKELDTRILFNEREALMNASVLDWKLTGEPIPNVQIRGWIPQEAYSNFMRRHKEIGMQ